ncbi:alpha/beta hydrolase [Roseateles sp. DAIF2]|uniref:alpha/beta fold hydrolase n=1 Tax=Roseateles sp. DAIF2 TaxID=2714952 RepID=UPI0018A2E79C|nr:alpha/beta hydrolase [Roseateles sp. DAIF2]QPF75996.1 alpha/beta hydrolase [Roseateles sp. DAIF2]
MKLRQLAAAVATALISLSLAPQALAAPVAEAPTARVAAEPQIRYRSLSIDGVELFYREAGPAQGPVLLLLHGFPTSSHMFRELIPRLATKYRVIAPDYPGFGHSAMPPRERFAYTFDNYAGLIGKLTEALGASKYSLYVMDYGAPVGYRLATRHPERVSALIVQNGNAYEEGIEGFWDPIKAYWKTGAAPEREALRWLTSIKATRWQYSNGVADASLLSPDAWTVDQALLDRPGNQEVQLDLFYDYRRNLPLYPVWQAYFRKHQPPTLVVWGKNDAIFVAAGAAPYKRDLPEAEIHLLDTGHFALETHGPQIAGLIDEFLARKLPAQGAR